MQKAWRPNWVKQLLCLDPRDGDVLSQQSAFHQRSTKPPEQRGQKQLPVSWHPKDLQGGVPVRFLGLLLQLPLLQKPDLASLLPTSKPKLWRSPVTNSEIYHVPEIASIHGQPEYDKPHGSRTDNVHRREQPDAAHERGESLCLGKNWLTGGMRQHIDQDHLQSGLVQGSGRKCNVIVLFTILI